LYKLSIKQGINHEYATIARNVKMNAYVDNTVAPGKVYFYKIKATDQSLNQSG
jgi:fibronectin type 3 domain-containing protein